MEIVDTVLLHGKEIFVGENNLAFVCEEHKEFVKNQFGFVFGRTSYNEKCCCVGCEKKATHRVRLPETYGGVPVRNYEITFVDYDGETKEETIDISYDEDWGDIQDWYKDGERYIGWGNEEDGYREITKVVDLTAEKEVDPFEWYERVRSYADDYSA